MIPVEYYRASYYGIISMVLMISFLPVLKYDRVEKFPKSNLKIGLILLLLVAISFIGLRDPWGSWRYFGDTGRYTRTFEAVKNNVRTEFSKDVGFYLFMKASSLLMNVKGFYVICATLYLLPVYYTFNKWFKEYTLFALAAFITSMSFWGFGINGIRNGLATSIFIFALAFKEKKWLMYSLMFLSVTFHKSMLLPMVAYAASSYYKNTKILILGWLIAIPVAYMFGNQLETIVNLIFESSSTLEDDRVDAYFTGEVENKIGDSSFRLDFILYSAIPICLGYWFIYKKNYQDEFYRHLLNTYIIANMTWLFLIYAPYTNRIAYLSWFLMPMILTYPLLKQKILLRQLNTLVFIIFSSLAFTLIMEFK